MNKRILIRWLVTVWLSPATILCSVAGWAAWEVGMAVSENRGNVKIGVGDVFAETRDITIAVLKPCKKDHPETCGLIPAVRQTVQDTGAAVNVMQQQVAQTQPLINAAAKTLGDAGDAVKDSAGHINKTADAASGTLVAASGTLNATTKFVQTLTIDSNTANDLMGQLKPLIASYTATGNDLDTTIKTANGIMASPNVTIMLANGAQFTTTAVQLEQKLAQCTLHPTLPCVLKSDILFGAQVGGYLLR